jgi:zinc-binding in reverse transcriptase
MAMGKIWQLHRFAPAKKCLITELLHTLDKLKPLWKLKVPLKVQILLWLTLSGKFATKDNISQKGWQGDMTCL